MRREENANEAQAPQSPIGPLDEQISHDEFKVAFRALAQAVTAQAYREVVSPVNPQVNTAAISVKVFTRMNPVEFHGSKVDDDP